MPFANLEDCDLEGVSLKRVLKIEQMMNLPKTPQEEPNADLDAPGGSKHTLFKRNDNDRAINSRSHVVGVGHN